MAREPKRRIWLVELDDVEGAAISASNLSAVLAEHLPGDRHPKVWGIIGARDIRGAYHKLKQLSRETEGDASKGDRVHSAHKALSFFYEMWPTAFARAALDERGQ